MKALTLFSGIGGFDLALERAGVTVDSVCEIDKNAQSVLRRHFPSAELYTDVKNIGVNTHARGSIDIICGGFPCQDLSIAGKRKGLDGERSGLWYEFARIIDELEPKWVVIENVPGLLSSAKGGDFAIILQWLAERGYCVAWRVLDAQYFGVAQRRRRVFVVASFRNGRAAEILFEPESLSGNTPPSRESWEEIAGTLGVRTFASRNQPEGVVTFSRQRTDDVVSTISRRDYKSATDLIAQTLTGSGSANGSPDPLNSTLVFDTEVDHIFQDSEFGVKEYPTAGTLRSGREPHHQMINMPLVGVRRLTPLECERLQGFTSIKETIIIDVCLDHQKNSASVEIKSRKSQKHAESAGKIGLSENAPFVEMNTNTNDQQTNKLAQPSVLINCGERKVEILNQEKFLLSASFAEDKNLFPMLTQSEDFALLLAGLNIILAQITQHGVEALHPKEQSLIHLKDGLSAVRLSGNEMMQLVKNVESDLVINKKLLKSITSDPLNLKIADTTLTTLLYSVIHAISGYIPEEILKNNSFRVEINTDFGHTFGQSDSARYKQLGNAVAVPVVEWICKRIASL